MNLARVFLNDSVGDGQAQARSASLTWARRGLSGEERIVDALQVFRCNARAGIRNEGFNVAVGHGGDTESTAAGHGFLGIQKEIEKNLLQLAGVAVDGRQTLIQIDVDGDLSGLELVL